MRERETRGEREGRVELIFPEWWRDTRVRMVKKGRGMVTANQNPLENLTTYCLLYL
jgi:hypothetical protein